MWSVDDALASFEKWMELKGVTKATRSSFSWAVRDFLKFVEGRKPSPQDVVDYIRDKPENEKRWLWYVLRRAFKVWGIEWLSPHDEELYKPKKPEKITRTFLTMEEYKRLEEVVKQRFPTWLYLAIRIAVETGARQLEIATLKRDDFIPNENKLRIYGVKRGREGVIIISEELADAIKTYLASRKDKNPSLLVDSQGESLKLHVMYRILKRAFKVAKIRKPRLGWHVFKRTWARWALLSGLDVKSLQVAGRWATPTMPLIYAEIEESEAVRAEAMKHPLKAYKPQKEKVKT